MCRAFVLICAYSITYLNSKSKPLTRRKTNKTAIPRIKLILVSTPLYFMILVYYFSSVSLEIFLVTGRPPSFPFSREALAFFLLLIEPRATAAGFLVFIMIVTKFFISTICANMTKSAYFFFPHKINSQIPSGLIL